MKALTKKASAVAILAAMSAPGLAIAAGPTVYGLAHLSVGPVSEDDGTTDNSSIAITSHKSRVGVKGDIDTDGSLKIVYKLEWEIDMDDNAKSSSDHIKARNQYAGLKDSWGEVRIGRDDSPYKTAGRGRNDFMGNTWADYNNIIDKGQDTRNDNSISYRVKAGPGQIGLMYAAGDDAPAAENAGAGTSIAYDAKVSNFKFALATQTIEQAPSNDETATKLVLSYKMSNTSVGLIYETVEDDLSLDDTNTYLGFQQQFGDKDYLKIAYGFKDQGLANDATMTAVLYEHRLSDDLRLYGLWASGADNGLLDESKLAGDSSVLVTGIVAKF